MMGERQRVNADPALRHGSRIEYPPGLVIRSAEASRMTGLRSMPVALRQAAVDALLRKVRR